MASTEVSNPHRIRRAGLIAMALAIGAVGMAAPAAHAQGPGVIFEPGSPSYKEYSIPLEQARRDAGGGIPGSIDSRAFGIGLSRRAGKGDSTGGARSGAGGRPAGTQRKGGGAGRGSSKVGGKQRPDLSERLADAEAAGAPAFWQVGTLLLVLLPGLLVGLLLLARRRGQGWAT